MNRLDYPAYSIVGDRNTILVAGADTGGAYCVVEAFVPPGHGPPPHVHQREDEAFFIVEGEFEFTVDGKSTRLVAGGQIFGRRGIPHSFKNVGSSDARLIFILTPAGLDEFFMEIGTPLKSRDDPPVSPTEADIARMVAAAPRFGLEIMKSGDEG